MREVHMTFSCRCSTLILIVGLALSGFSCSKQEANGQQGTGTSLPGQQEKKAQIHWLSFNEGLAKAQTENRMILLNFYTDWCVFCKKLDKETFQDQAVTSMLAENYVAVRLNAESSEQGLVYRGRNYTNAEFARYFRVTAYPSLAFLDAEGQPITVIPGFLPANQFLVILKYVRQKCYLTRISLHEFAAKGVCN
jgi:thioredoxin-related protein